MNILLLGGTAWLGRWIAQTAVREGHQVSCLARGVSGPLPVGCEHLRADRSTKAAYAPAAQRCWDVVIDLARQPGQVRDAAQAFAAHCARYVYVSSTSVYAEHAQIGQDESAPLLAPFAGDVLDSMDNYGAAKRACELQVQLALGPERCMIVRPGLIGGPGDESDRTGYWPWRFAKAKAAGNCPVLVPDAAALLTQVIDVRDLARWIVHAGCSGVSGVFNALGPAIPFPQHIQTARELAGHTGPLVWANANWLRQMGVTHWAGPKSLPLWLPSDTHAGFAARTAESARQQGLMLRPLADTLRDTLTWEESRGERQDNRLAGLSGADEVMLLAARA